MKCQGVPSSMLSTERHPVFLLGFWGSTGAPFPILRRNVTTLFEGCILVFKNMLKAKLLPFQTRLRAWAVSERTREGLLRSGYWGDPPPIRWQDVNPNPVHTKTTLAESPQQSTGSAAPVPRGTTATARPAPTPRHAAFVPGRLRAHSPGPSAYAVALRAPSCPTAPGTREPGSRKPNNQNDSDAAGDDVPR